MEYDIPPVAKSQRSGFLDETILQISKELFEIPLFGIGISGIINILIIYLWYKRVTVFFILFFLFLYYLIIRVIQIRILGR